jgi:hypothetical protein
VLTTPRADQILKVNDVLSVDEEHGIVVGWAIVCTKDGEPYYDLNVDRDGVHKGKRVPEHITPAAVIKAMIDAAEVGVMAGNEMHEGPETGHFVGMFFMDQAIAKSLGMTTTTEGLLVQYKPEPDVLAKFKDGTYTGFSIEGARIEYEEIEEAA